jgi:hypothetical protein
MSMMTGVKGFFRRKKYNLRKKNKWRMCKNEVPGCFIIRIIYSLEGRYSRGIKKNLINSCFLFVT